MASHVIKNNGMQIFFSLLCFLKLGILFFIKADIFFQIQQPFLDTVINFKPLKSVTYPISADVKFSIESDWHAWARLRNYNT